MFNDTSSPLALLLTRRSGKARYMIAPGPDDAQMAAILAAATRVPDHGKLAPWRFVVVGSDQRETLASVLVKAYRDENPAAGRLEIEAMEAMAHQAPALVVALHVPRPESKIPTWEQELSVGAACMQLINGAHAQGFVACWLTGWPTYSEGVRNAFGAAPERVAGFIFLGTAGRELEERPRPDPAQVISHWTPPA
jgi:nitroreductase